MNRANMAKQITEVPMAGCKPKGMMKGGMVKTGYKKGGKVKSGQGRCQVLRCAAPASKWRWG
jgi:hypothetical protein